MHDILTLQSMKENPYSARDTKVTIDKKENPQSAQDTNVTIDEKIKTIDILT